MLLLVLGGAVVGAELLSRTTAQTDELADRYHPARVEMYRLQNALLNQETGVRGYVIARHEDFLAPYVDGRAQERRSADRLESLIGFDPRLAADLNAIREAADAWRSEHARPLIDRARAGETRAGSTEQVEASRRSFEELRTLFGVQSRHMAEARKEAREDLASLSTTRDLVYAGMILAFVIACLALTVLLRRAVGRPLRALRERSQRVADGEFDLRIEAAGPSDLRAVAQSVEAMRHRIVAELEETLSREARLTRQTGELDAQAVELRRSNAELEQFAYVASHDLQEPLRKVASFCQLLEKRYGGELDERGKQYIDFAVDGAKRMQILINDLLTFSRVGRLNDERSPVPMGQVLDRALSNLAAAAEESGAVVERPEELPEVVGDPTTLTMLWQNLVGNAIKFRSPDRAPRVVITAEPAEDGGSWQFCVADNGIGIPPEFGEKVFIIFQRLHGRDAYAGTGIGLALCKKIVEHHGGQIALDPGPTEGTRICFTLPVRPEPAALPSPEEAATA
ncbi:sensor histidine kinase [Streptomyces zingiberis]|uniref:histidine kinase n=1 Tax=Streptomyces zingiberis TaxID=2053010 RepID=A0ABX1BV87_9ACTN|nr:sensor histidine kinase [Streptomyces zingiberis]NJQ00356.1 HAMP domain-containing protein [Streptomyces zingiberis]